MSQCILELKYIEGNKNNKALKEGSVGRNVILCFLADSLNYIWGYNWDPEKSETNKQTKLRILNDFRVEFCFFSY